MEKTMENKEKENENEKEKKVRPSVAQLPFPLLPLPLLSHQTPSSHPLPGFFLSIYFLTPLSLTHTQTQQPAPLTLPFFIRRRKEERE